MKGFRYRYLTSALRWLLAGGVRRQNACVTGQRGQSRAGHEGTQTVLISAQDPDGFQTGELTAGLDFLVEKTEYQLTQVLQNTGTGQCTNTP